jgi:hypothetical protein
VDISILLNTWCAKIPQSLPINQLAINRLMKEIKECNKEQNGIEKFYFKNNFSIECLYKRDRE